METSRSDKNKQIIATLVVLVVILLIVAGTKALSSKNETASDASSTQTAGSSEGSSSAPLTATTYKDGTYSATGTYTSPGGSQAIEVSVTISNDTVMATTATEKASDSASQEFQEDFIAGYKSQVIGKSLSSLSLSHVSGSSLTSQGFNNAIKQIKDRAKA